MDTIIEPLQARKPSQKKIMSKRRHTRTDLENHRAPVSKSFTIHRIQNPENFCNRWLLLMFYTAA